MGERECENSMFNELIQREKTHRKVRFFFLKLFHFARERAKWQGTWVYFWGLGNSEHLGGVF